MRKYVESFYEINPCPFCGGKARLYRIRDGYYIKCSTPFCRAEQVTCKEEKEAVKRWNKRVKSGEEK